MQNKMLIYFQPTKACIEKNIKNGFTLWTNKDKISDL
jgi:hypothetical protein